MSRGIDMIGEVESAGPGDTRVKPGDHVFGDIFGVGSGAWAEYVAVPERALTSAGGSSVRDVHCGEALAT